MMHGIGRALHAKPQPQAALEKLFQDTKAAGKKRIPPLASTTEERIFGNRVVEY
jgi:hypothetical protein